MKKWIPPMMILGGFALLIWGYVDLYQQELESLREPGAMYCGFLPFGVLSDLFWMEQYRWHLIGCTALVLGGVVLRWILKRAEEKVETT